MPKPAPYKVIADALKFILDNDYYCPHCQVAVGNAFAYGAYQSGTYHTVCGNDVVTSDLIDVHHDMLQEALFECERAINAEEDEKCLNPE